MGHLIFIFLHLIAVLFAGGMLLFITIPLHLIYAGTRKKRDPNAPNPWTHVKCPDCKEFVRKEANVCKHCRCKLIPQK